MIMLLNHSRRSVSAALLLLSLGLLLVCLGAVWQHAPGPLLHPAAAQNDFLHGFSIGLGLAMEVVSVVILARICAVRAKL
jgi:hypothetical protein